MLAFFMMFVVLVRSPVLSAFFTHDCYRGGGSNPDASLEHFAFIGSSVLGAEQQGSISGRGMSKREARAGAYTMALECKLRKPRNMRGDFFVDESCVDCDVCRWMDPRTFTRSGLGSIVSSQPNSEEERMSTFKAMLACPTGSIRTMRPDKKVIDALASFPLAVDEERLPNVYQLAPTTKASLGNTAYLIVRPDEGNIMIDVPRFLKKTAANVEALGGVKYLIVTARNNAIGHEPWKAKFPGMIRILHRFDLQRKTRIMEERLDGIGPWFLVAEGKESPEAGYVTGDTARFDFVRVPKEKRASKDPSVKIVGLPGQTRGSVGVVFETETKDGVMERAAFTGGTVGFSTYLKRLDTFPRTVETDRQLLASSVRRLAEEGVTSLLPGRGARTFFNSPEEATARLRDAADDADAIPDYLRNPMVVPAEAR